MAQLVLSRLYPSENHRGKCLTQQRSKLTNMSITVALCLINFVWICALCMSIACDKMWLVEDIMLEKASRVEYIMYLSSRSKERWDKHDLIAIYLLENRGKAIPENSILYQSKSTKCFKRFVFIHTYIQIAYIFTHNSSQ